MIYLDAGATTLEKPACVREAMARAVQTMTSPGRAEEGRRLAAAAEGRLLGQTHRAVPAAAGAGDLYAERDARAEHRDPDTRAPGEPGRDLGL